METLDKVIPQVRLDLTNFSIVSFLYFGTFFLFILVLCYIFKQDSPTSLDSTSSGEGSDIQPLPGLQEILTELLKENGYSFHVFLYLLVMHVFDILML